MGPGRDGAWSLQLRVNGKHLDSMTLSVRVRGRSTVAGLGGVQLLFLTIEAPSPLPSPLPLSIPLGQAHQVMGMRIANPRQLSLRVSPRGDGKLLPGALLFQLGGVGGPQRRIESRCFFIRAGVLLCQGNTARTKDAQGIRLRRVLIPDGTRRLRAERWRRSWRLVDRFADADLPTELRLKARPDAAGGATLKGQKSDPLRAPHYPCHLFVPFLPCHVSGLTYRTGSSNRCQGTSLALGRHRDATPMRRAIRKPARPILTSASLWTTSSSTAPPALKASAFAALAAALFCASLAEAPRLLASVCISKASIPLSCTCLSCSCRSRAFRASASAGVSSAKDEGGPDHPEDCVLDAGPFAESSRPRRSLSKPSASASKRLISPASLRSRAALSASSAAATRSAPSFGSSRDREGVVRGFASAAWPLDASAFPKASLRRLASCYRFAVRVVKAAAQ